MAYEHAYVITGGIASGKSTVTRLLQDFGLEVIDADEITKECLSDYKIKSQIKDALGSSAFEANGTINKKAVSAIVFGNEQKRELLNKIMHPAIKTRIKAKSIELDKQNKPYIMDIALFFETNDYKGKKVAVVYVPLDLQKKRLMKRDNIDEKTALNKINSQINTEEKKRLGDLVIDNTLDLDHLKKEVGKFWDIICNDYQNHKGKK